MSGKRALSRSEVEAMVSRAERLRDKAFIAFLYLSAARVGEVCRRLRREDFWVEDSFLLVKLPTEKNRDVDKRLVPMPLWDPLTQVVLRYLETLRPDEVCWPFSQQYARKLVKKLGGPHVHPHLFRHSRVTHLIVEYGLNQFELKRFAGWSDVRPVKFYEHLIWRDYAPKLDKTCMEKLKRGERRV